MPWASSPRGPLVQVAMSIQRIYHLLHILVLVSQPPMIKGPELVSKLNLFKWYIYAIVFSLILSNYGIVGKCFYNDYKIICYIFYLCWLNEQRRLESEPNLIYSLPFRRNGIIDTLLYLELLFFLLSSVI